MRRLKTGRSGPATEDRPQREALLKTSTFAAFGAIAFLSLAAPAHAQQATAPDSYGSAKFESYADIDKIEQIKMVWDFNFADPKAVNGVFNNLAALLKATAEFGPHSLEPIKVVIVSHGPEVVVFAKKNYEKYKEIVDRAASYATQGVRFEICRNAAAAQGFAPADLYGFTTVVPAGPYALAYWQAKGYALNAVGATAPTPPVNDLNRADTNKK
ncbi:MAG: DsrE family protein [Hyphomicrobiales bacterium]|nr:DsrE family protein [Hyphomicrobiales bacterium]